MFVLKKHVSTITNTESLRPSSIRVPLLWLLPTLGGEQSACRKIMALPWGFLHLGVGKTMEKTMVSTFRCGKNHEKTMVLPSETLRIMGSSHIYMTLYDYMLL